MYTIRQAALRAGVSIPLLRAWERRYNVVRPERTASGYRLYDDVAIDRLRAMRRLVESGWSASQAAREILSKEPSSEPASRAPAGPIAVGPGVPQSAGPGPALAGAVADAFVDAAAALDEERLNAILDEMFARGSFERVVDEHVFPALRALGDAWAAGTVSVAGEHAASHAVLRRLAAAFEAAGHGPADRPVLVGLPPGSRHELGALAFATALRRRGVPVVYLGTDVPVDAWTAAARRTGARGIVVAVPTSRDRTAARQVVEAIQTANPQLIVAAGGRAAATARLPSSALVLPDGLPTEAAAFERAIASRGP